MNFWPLVLVGLVTAGVMVGGWYAQTRSRNAGIVDVLWAGSMAASAVFLAVTGRGDTVTRCSVALLGGIWGLRLAWHLGRRVLREPEDGRYQALRAHWHDDQRLFLGLFLVQAVAVVLFSVPFWIACNHFGADTHWWVAMAVLTWLVSLGGESIADAQLAHHRANPANAGSTCRSGLWRYSRHPNYFFEVLQWFAYVFLAVGAGPVWIAASLSGPLVMLVSICWVTGIPYTEAQALRSRGEDYRDYQRKTSILIPWFPRE